MRRTIKHDKPRELHAGHGQRRQRASHLSVWSRPQTDARLRAESRQRVDFRLSDGAPAHLSEFNLTGPAALACFIVRLVR